MKALIVCLMVLISTVAKGNILVLEVEVPEDDYLHGSSVEWIACQNNMQACELQYVLDFSTNEFKQKLRQNLKVTNIANMSFTIQKPDRMEETPWHMGNPDFEKALQANRDAIATWTRDHQTLKNVILENPNHLFVAAAGNGKPIGMFHSQGVALEENDALFPQVMEQPNLIKVSALDIDAFDIQSPVDYKIAEYSNYGLFYTELAAPVEPNENGEYLDGSSFAAPYVSRLAEEVMNQHPSLTASDVRNIFLRSCHVKNKAKALWATRDLLTHKKKSVVFWSMYETNRAKRLKLQEEKFSDVTLVQCGGVISRKLALQCSENYVNGVFNTLDDACMDAHKQITTMTGADQLNLSQMWKLRFSASIADRVLNH